MMTAQMGVTDHLVCQVNSYQPQLYFVLPSATQSAEQMSAMYVSTNYRHVETLHFFIFQLDISLGSIINLLCFVCLGLDTKTTWLRCWFKVPVLAVTNTGGDVPTASQNYVFCCHKYGCKFFEASAKTSSGFRLANCQLHHHPLPLDVRSGQSSQVINM